MRENISLNAPWRYTADFSGDYIAPDFDDSSWQDIRLPHANIELPYNGFDENEYQFVSCYRRDIDIPKKWKARRVAVHFEGVMLSCRIWFNGVDVAEHKGGYTPFDVDITPLIRPGERNQLTVMVDSREHSDIPPFGKVVDFLTFGGIYREVSLVVTDRRFVQTLRMIEFAPPVASGRKARPASAKYLAEIGGVTADDSGLELELSLFEADSQRKDDGGLVARTLGAVDAAGICELRIEPGALRLWDVDDPYLYRIETRLLSGGQEVDSFDMRSGFRRAEFRSGGFFLNGRKIKIIGLNRHQSYPYLGYAMPRRAQRRDADILKDELGINLVRTSHYPQSRHFLDRCDEIGLLVMEEIPGWQNIGAGNDWQDLAVANTRDMILADAHHPSIVLWGVRINESPDNHELYTRTNAAARELDPLRQTGGVRDFAGSEFLEDVYTYNDFTHDGSAGPLKSRHSVARRQVPYLVTEYNGHMYPTKRFDQEERLVEHSLRHGRVVSAARQRGDITGAIGWCAFDYNTHKEFGSGDRICYHGVMDMFRIPKFAASTYASQTDPDRGLVMEPLSLFSLGERKEAKSLPVYVFTNCDFVRVFRNDEHVGDYYRSPGTGPAGGTHARDARERGALGKKVSALARILGRPLSGLEYPPVIIDEMVGSRLDGHRFSRREVTALKALLARIHALGLGSLSIFQWLHLAWIFLHRGYGIPEGTRIFNQASTGWGDGEQRYRLEGWYNGQCALVREFGPSVPARLSARADDRQLSAVAGGDAWDTTRIVFRLEDQFGNITPFVNEFIEFDLKGPGEIIGPEKTALIGGTIAVWVRVSGTSGTLKLTGRCGRFASGMIEIQIV